MMKLNIQLFASGEFDLAEGKGSGNNYLYGNIEWEYTTGTSEQNYSTVTARIYAKRNGSTPTTGKSWSGSISIGNYKTEDIYFDSSISVGSSYRLMATVSTQVPHNDDGTKSVVISGTVRGPSGTTLASAISSGSQTIQLATIPRASTFNSITASITSTGSFTVNTTKKSATFYDRLEISYGGTLIKTINNVISGSTYSFTASELNTLYALYGNNLALSLTCTLKTFNSSSYTTQVGSSSIKIMVCNLPTYNLQWGAISVVDNITTYNTFKPTATTFIKGLSQPKFTFSASSTTGSTYGNNITYKLNDIIVNSPYIIQNYTGIAYTLSATDGRKTITNIPTMTAINYSLPVISNLTVVRPTPTATTANVNITIKYYDGTGLINLLTRGLTFVYQETQGTTYTKTLSDFTIDSETTSNNITTLTAHYQISGLNYQKNMTYTATFADKIGKTIPRGGNLNAGIPCWNAYQDNNYNNVFKVNGKAKTSDLNVSGEADIRLYNYFNDTSGNGWEEMMKNKLDYCIANITTTKTNFETFINGGWAGWNFGHGIYSKIGTNYMLTWFSTYGIYYCIKSGTRYKYKKTSGIEPEIVSNSNGTAIKFDTGIMICYKTFTQNNVVLDNPWYTLYTNHNDGVLNLGNFAANFKSGTVPTVTYSYSGGNACWVINNPSGITNSSAGGVQLATVSARTIGTCIINIVAIGVWK